MPEASPQTKLGRAHAFYDKLARTDLSHRLNAAETEVIRLQSERDEAVRARYTSEEEQIDLRRQLLESQDELAQTRAELANSLDTVSILQKELASTQSEVMILRNVIANSDNRSQLSTQLAEAQLAIHEKDAQIASNNAVRNQDLQVQTRQAEEIKGLKTANDRFKRNVRLF